MKVSFSLFVALCVSKGFAHSANDGIARSIFHESRKLASCAANEKLYKTLGAGGGQSSCTGPEIVTSCQAAFDHQVANKCISNVQLPNLNPVFETDDSGTTLPGCYAVKTGNGSERKYVHVTGSGTTVPANSWLPICNNVDCTSNNDCDNGTCDLSTGTCVCDTGFAGKTCDVCASNFEGTNCDTCINNFTGANCDQCNTPFAGADCDDCASNFEGTNCDTCINNFTGANCDQCDAPFAGADCDECASNFEGTNCDTCINNFTGANCDQCDAPFAEADCDECASNFEGTNCDTCINNFTGANCDQCNTPFAGADCDKCASNFEGTNCDTCINNFTGANCDQCDAPFAGADCDKCASNFEGTNCDTCINNFTGANCDQCDAPFAGADCDKCASNFEGTNCDTCINNFTGANCDVCPPNYAGADCDECASNFEGTNCDTCINNFTGANCDVCPPNYAGAACDQCAPDYSGSACVLDPCQNHNCPAGQTCVPYTNPTDENSFTCTGTPTPPVVVSIPDPCDSVKCKRSECKIDGSGEAYCQCETSFQYNANNKSCDCPAGTTFVQSINRCVSPTSAPTKSPTASPTTSPTKSPTPSPVEPPADVDGLVTEDDCTDSSGFTFKLDIGNRVPCSWLTKSNAGKRKAKYCGETHIYSACQESCGACNVQDASGDSVFKLDKIDKMVGCDWLTKNKQAIDTRRNNYCFSSTNCEEASDVGSLCPVACGFASGENAERDCPEGDIGAILIEPISSPDPPSPSGTASVPATSPSSKGSSKGLSKGSSKGSSKGGTGRQLRYRTIRK
ncbi:hypothetical protein CTEN210_00887 [Chaetoceros tenuissimus]|uniref:EGF-like domain-containing protein n=1 Tax=Chaetoceros tenuissimus TaxID=426638 RepID=A0AAD3CF09_9STRA|nr:hypothetical protein CTEN210_00887 [Chaetoceros tenuissimus]